jgi:hypothetical protein
MKESLQGLKNAHGAAQAALKAAEIRPLLIGLHEGLYDGLLPQEPPPPAAGRIGAEEAADEN